MRAIIQRVSNASVTIDSHTSGEIGHGLLVLLGIVNGDGEDEVDWLVGKIARMRIFADDEGKMNRCIKDVDGELLVVSQFTLHASTKKGNRPSFIKAARPETAIPLYQKFLATAEKEIGKACASGEFGADMQVKLVNDGPVTIMIDTELRE
ncbi:MAG: D-tyrosyl-tRNA(Tyr) deacylase [Verrucomicrobiae bacterium]|nr:D-tyrosyl-tRNA(Tyr) deacylase [Verrucomicrobiae bacterium]NNJ85958.1 D-tyrosyl-tRNA(Tyr) deacylase [Akkermansiaceae bacterium]